MKLFRWWFNGKTIERDDRPRQPEITIGSLWVLKAKGDPFPSKYPPSQVLDVKDGWVRYYLSEYFPDERCKVDLFLAVYKPMREVA